MATAQEIEDQSLATEILSRETSGIQDLITGVSSIDTWTIVCLVQKDLIDSLISQLKAAKDLENGDPLKESVLIFNSGNQPITISNNQVNAVGNHLKGVFLPAALEAKEAERDTAIDVLVALKNE